MSNLNDEDMKEMIQHTSVFHMKLIESISKIDHKHVSALGIVQSLLSIAVQGIVFKGDIESYKKTFHMVLDEVINKSYEFGMLQREDENV